MSSLSLWNNKLTGTSILCSSCPVWYTSIPAADNRSINYFTGQIPTELGRCSAMNWLYLQNNKLTGTHFCAHSSPLVYEYTILQSSEFFLRRCALCEKTRWCLHSAQCGSPCFAAPAPSHRARRVQDVHEAEVARLPVVPVIARQPAFAAAGTRRACKEEALQECVEARTPTNTRARTRRNKPRSVWRGRDQGTRSRVSR